MSERQLETGKRWVNSVFEHISTELKDTVAIVHYDWQDNDSEYRFCFQVAGQDKEVLSLSRGTLLTCARPNYGAVRQRIEAAIRHRLTRSDAAE